MLPVAKSEMSCFLAVAAVHMNNDEGQKTPWALLGVTTKAQSTRWRHLNLKGYSTTLSVGTYSLY